MPAFEPESHTFRSARPSEWVARFARLLPDGASVLDFACGSGRNLGPFAQRGARIVAADRDPAALAALPVEAERVEADLEADPWPFAARRFDAVVCCNFLHRPRLGLLFGLVAPGGLIIYETFARGNERYGKPSNPAFLLAPGELLSAAAHNGFEVLAYEHGFTGGGRPAIVQRLCAVRPPFDPERRALVG